MSQQDIINILQKDLRKYLEDHGIKHLFLFGSYATNQANAESDIDLFYETKANTSFGLNFFSLINLLEAKLNKKVDLIDKKFINKKIKKYILADKIQIF